MKKAILAACFLLMCINTFAQLSVNSSGNTLAKNLVLEGITGIDSTGVLTISAQNSRFSTQGIPPTLISMKSDEDEIYPIIHYKYGNPLFFVNNIGYVFSGMYVTFSDSTSKTNIIPLESSLEKLKQLQGVEFNYKVDLEASKNESTMARTPAIQKQIMDERSRKRIGLIAQDVEKVFPEVVRTQFDGKKGIIYSDLIGVLINAINEMEEKYTEQLTNLQEQLNAVLAVVNANKEPEVQDQQEKGNKISAFKGEGILYQNTPNPFKQQTTIAYRLPYDIKKASLCIYNLNGQQIQKYDLDISTIANSITIDASTLPAGMYIYGLIIDGRIVTSKRMILTE